MSDPYLPKDEALSTAVLIALRRRAIERNKVRTEIADYSKRGQLAYNSDMPSWRVYQAAELALNAALTAWEISEGVET
jgi:hypothetical protein